jgi:hypothetical protein
VPLTAEVLGWVGPSTIILSINSTSHQLVLTDNDIAKTTIRITKCGEEVSFTHQRIVKSLVR